MIGQGASWRRRTAAVAANLALLSAVSGVVVYAVSAEGYRSHQAELNDGGIWFTNAKDGYFGRVNKPIGQQDASAFGGVDAELDVVQDGAAVVGLDRVARTLTAIAPDRVALAEEGSARIPSRGVVQLSGGSLAVLDPTTGAVRAQRLDTAAGAGALSGVDAAASEVAQVGPSAAVAVTLGGTILATAAGSDSVTRVAPIDAGFAAPVETALGATFQDVSVTAVGESPIVLDTTTGDLVAPGRTRAVVEPGSVLQQPGPDADSVLLATDTALLSVDLATGATSVIAEGRSGRPTAPVRLGDCVYGAWSGGRGSVVTQCGGAEPNVAQSLRGNASDLVFRVNRGQIMLNDRYSGAVWNLDVDNPTRLDNWEAFNSRDDEESKNPDTQENENGDRRPPKAKPDFFGARPGRTTVLYPLDNDTVPEGRILSIRSVDQVSNGEADLSIGPDGQTLQITLPPDAQGTTSLEYYVDDGRQDVSAHATVTVATRSELENQAPSLRPGFKPTVWPVPAGGAIELPVLPDWRDKRDGDSLALVGASLGAVADAGAAAQTTTAGRVRFTAPPRPGQVEVTYTVSDGRSEPVATDLVFRIQDPDLDDAVAARAEADVAAVDAGRWVTIRPLANDLPGADPRSPRAQLRLAGTVSAPAGADVRTDIDNGLVMFRSSVARTFSLEYEAAYGDAPIAVGKIRVDVRPRENRAPVAVPDSATIYGSAATLVDVLANDVDPAGGLLSVQGTRALDQDQVDVAIVEGRWLRVSARQGALRPSPQVVRYTVTNGARTAVGEVTVTQRGVPEDDAPVTEEDEVVVRAGAALTIAPLDNDFSPSGDPLGLVADVSGEAAGELTVRSPDGASGRTGRATVSGRLVRYVAPQVVSGEGGTFQIRYVATNSRGDTAPGLISVSVIPAEQPNRPPAPPVIEDRTASGGTVVLKLPGVGVDPDGDAVTVLGLASAPRLGRVMKVGANSITYQAYPGAHGTDQFDYTLTDSAGSRSTGTVRVGVSKPGKPQPPLAVADTMTVEPGRAAVVDPLGNDLVAPGDSVTIELVDPPAGVELESDLGPVVLRAPARADGRALEVVYRITNGLDSSQSTITLRTRTPYNNPPVVFDSFGAATDSAVVRAAVLRTAYDPDGDSARLRVTDVYPPAGVVARIERGRITVARGVEPIVVPFRVEDVDGGVAIAQVYVPATGSGVPYVKPGAVIEVGSGATLSARLSEYVVNPTGGALRFTVAQKIAASPASSVNALITGKSTFTVSGAAGYQGPGAVTFEVANAADETLAEAEKVLLSVPVQVGDDRPVVDCPTDAIEVPQGGRIELNPAAVCRVFAATAEDESGPTWTADWQRSVEGLDIIVPSGDAIVLAAESSVAAGSEAVLLVRADGSEPARLRVRVVGATSPTLAAIRVTDLRAGESRVVDLAPYLVPGVTDPVPTFVRAGKISGPDVRVESAGGSSVRISAGESVSGQADFRVVMSDVASSTDTARQASNVLSVELLGVPDVPDAPVPASSVLSGAVQLGWRAPEANGSPIDSYELRASNGDTQRCPTTACIFTGLTDGTSYTFTVRAHNSVGWSAFSPASRQASPDAVPGVVGEIRVIKADDGVLSLAWAPPTSGGSEADEYRITWSGGQDIVTAPTYTVTGLDNDRPYVFTVEAGNEQGWGTERRSRPYQSVGPPGIPDAPKITPFDVGSGSQADLTISWDEVEANGPGAITYTVYRNGLQIDGCRGISVRECVVREDYDGQRLKFEVSTVIGPTSSPKGDPAFWLAVAKPLEWGAWTVEPTGTGARARVAFTVPDSRGEASNVSVRVNGNPSSLGAITGPMTRTIDVPDTDKTYRVELTVCNESAECTTSGSQSVQAWGPLREEHIVSVTPTVDGEFVQWDIKVDANGAPATLVVESDSRATRTFSVTEADISTFSLDRENLGFGATERLRVRLSHDSDPASDAVSTEAQATTADPPAERIRVLALEDCNDGSGATPCHDPGDGGWDCTDASCGFITVRVRNFFDDVTCDVNLPGRPNRTGLGPYADDADSLTPAYYDTPGEPVTVTCRSPGRSATDTLTWPGG